MVYIYSLPDASGARYIIGVESEQLEKELKLSHTAGKGRWVVPGGWNPLPPLHRSAFPP